MDYKYCFIAELQFTTRQYIWKLSAVIEYFVI